MLSFRTYINLFYKLREVTVYEMGSAYTEEQICKSQPSVVMWQDEDTIKRRHGEYKESPKYFVYQLNSRK
jgi:hypothetical protein